MPIPGLPLLPATKSPKPLVCRVYLVRLKRYAASVTLTCGSKVACEASFLIVGKDVREADEQPSPRNPPSQGPEECSYQSASQSGGELKSQLASRFCKS